MQTVKFYVAMLLLMMLSLGSELKAQCTSASITINPVNSTVCQGALAFFSVTANGTGLTYQWQASTGGGFVNISDGPVYNGTNTSVLQIPVTTLANSGTGFRCRVAAACGPAVFTTEPLLSVNNVHTLTSQPVNRLICAGGNTTFEVNATAVGTNPISYQWQVNTGSGFINVPNSGAHSGVTTKTLVITAAPYSMNGNVYRCQVTSLCGPALLSNTAQLDIYLPPTIVSHPLSNTVCEDAPTGFSVTAAGNSTSYNFTYQWQVNTGSGFTDIGSVYPYQGQQTAGLSLISTPAGFNNNQYRCVVSSICAPTAITNPATLTVNTKPLVTTNPVNSTICEDGTATFTVAGTGTGLLYQWQVATGGSSTFTNIPSAPPYQGMQSTTLTITNTPASFDFNRYRCVISGTCTPASISAAAELRVNTEPVFTSQPANVVICNSNNIAASFSVAATGTGIGYQWQSQIGTAAYANVTNGGAYSGATTPNLSIANGSLALNGTTYRCVVTGVCAPPAISNSASLTINLAPAVTNNPLNTSVCEAGNTSFNISATGTGLVYQWQMSTGGLYSNLANAGVYSGVNTATLNITNATNSLNGNLYRCEVSGTCTPAAYSTGGILTVNALTVLSTHPSTVAICAGNNTSFSVGATAGGITYQWQVNTGSGFANVPNTPPYSGATAATLNIASTPLSFTGNQYRCIVGSICGPTITSNTAVLTVNVAPAITAPPVDLTICAGQVSSSFVVTATGTGLLYQWQANTGSGFANLANNVTYGGVTTNILTIANASAALNGNVYRVVVSGTCTPAVMASAQLNVNTSPVINIQPVNAVVCAGSTTNFNVNANGTALTYQWQVNSGSGFTNIANAGVYSGATTNNLTITGALSTMNNFTYQCVISGTCPAPVTTNARTLTVNDLPAITTQPTATTVCANSTATFTVAATGSSLTYQWQVNSGSGFTDIMAGAPYAGHNAATLTILSTPLALSGNTYRCVVGGTCTPSQTSNPVVLTVNSLPTITAAPVASEICAGTNTTFSVTATGTGIGFQWQVDNGTGFANISNGGVYSGATTNTLTITAATAGMNTFAYRCAVSGTCTPAVNSAFALLRVNTPPAISSQPTSSTICPGAATSFSVTTTGSTATNVFSYQWQVNTGSGFVNVANVFPYGGVTSTTLTIANAPFTFNNNQYRCVVTGLCTPAATSNTATLTVNAVPLVTTNPTNLTICEDATATFTVAGTGTGLLYQWQVATGGSSTYTNIPNSAPYVGMQSPTLTILNTPESFNFNFYRCVISGVCTPPSISTGAELTVNSEPEITTNPTNVVICNNNNIAASFSVVANGTGITYQWQSQIGTAPYANVTNGGAFSGATTATLGIFGGTVALNGTTFRCVVTGVCAPPAISSGASLTINMVPVITNNPLNTSVCEAANTSLTVSATGTGLVYQWQMSTGGLYSNLANGGVYSNVNTATLNITGATNSLNGNLYRCMVTGTCTPAAFSNGALLTVNALTVLTTSPSSVVLCEGTNTSFSVVATAGGITYQWQVNTGSGFTNVPNALPYSGATAATLNIAATPATLNNNQYRCIIGSICGPTLTSGVATLTVNTLPTITAGPANITLCAGSGTTFAVTATGTAIGYQWQLNTGSGFANLANGGIYSGATSNALGIASTTASMNGYLYRVVITGTCAPAAIATAQLNVNTAPFINVQPSNAVVCDGSNTLFNVNAVGTAITYQWQVNTGSGFTNITNGGVYSGATTNALNLTATPLSMNGYTYQCVISGTCPVPVTTAVRTLTVNGLPTIVGQPSNATTCVNALTTFTVNATGSGLAYQWQVNQGAGFINLNAVAPYSGFNAATLSILNTSIAMNGFTYRCVVSGSCTPTQTTNAVSLTVNTLPTVTSSPVATQTCAGSNASFSVGATGTAVAYQWQVDNGTGYSNIANGGVYSGANLSTLSITGATFSMNSYAYRCVVSGACAPAVNSGFAMLRVIVPPVITSHPVSLTLCNNSTVNFNVTSNGTSFQWQKLTTSGWSNVTDGGSVSGALTNNLRIANAQIFVHDGQYRCVVSTGCAPSVTSNVATFVLYGIPVIVNAPTTATVCENQTATFSVTVDALNPSYQWEENRGTGWVALTNGGTYSNVTGTTLQILNPSLAMSGYGYRCRISSTCGVNYSVDRPLVVQGRPRITKQPLSVLGGYNNPVTFSVDATGQDLTFQWQVDTTIAGNKTWVDLPFNFTYDGVNTNVLKVNPKQGYVNQRRYRCVVSGKCSPAEISQTAEIRLGFSNGVANVAGNDVELTVYPNPVTGNMLNIQLGNYTKSDVMVKITNNVGSVVANEQVSLQNNTGAINVANLATGVYNLHVSDKDNTVLKTIRFVKQ